MQHKRDVIIDCDTGVDDALALLFALRSPALNVLGITTVAGNVQLEKVVRNTLLVVEHSGKQVPVFRGASRPLTGSLRTAEYVHGHDGLGDIGFPDPQSNADDEHAVNFIIRTFMQATRPVDLITLAPLTNIALALSKEPKLEDRIHSLVMMAGGITGGNITPMAEFNVYTDPEAADIVLRSRIPKTMVPLEPIVEGATLQAQEVEQLEKTDTPWCWLAGRLLRKRLDRWHGPLSPCDVAAMGVAIDPTIAEAEMYHVAVELEGIHTRGMTVVDRRTWHANLKNAMPPNVNVVIQIDTQRYRNLFKSTLLAS